MFDYVLPFSQTSDVVGKAALLAQYDASAT
jgi:hypothetical protein